MRTLLILGGRPIGTIEIIERCKELGIKTIVIDNLNHSQSYGKTISDFSYNISVDDYENILKLEFDGIYCGVNEYVEKCAVRLSELSGKPIYINYEQLEISINKSKFKSLCSKYGLPVSEEYNFQNVKFPVITKPNNGSGSMGFYISYNMAELIDNYEKSKSVPNTDFVIIEKYQPYQSKIVHYTCMHGKCIYSCMSDKESKSFNGESSVMSIQTFPSVVENEYLDKYNEIVIRMFEQNGFRNGPIWIEMFYNEFDKDFIFNEMGYRFGGSLTNYPVKYFTGIDQLNLCLSISLCENINSFKEHHSSQKYAIIPVHINPGSICDIIGVNKLYEYDFIYHITQVHYINDVIESWNNARQVMFYLHILYNNDLSEKISICMDTLRVYDEIENNMIYTLYER